jgi:hypothetical protein
MVVLQGGDQGTAPLARVALQAVYGGIRLITMTVHEQTAAGAQIDTNEPMPVGASSTYGHMVHAPAGIQELAEVRGADGGGGSLTAAVGLRGSASRHRSRSNRRLRLAGARTSRSGSKRTRDGTHRLLLRSVRARCTWFRCIRRERTRRQRWEKARPDRSGSFGSPSHRCRRRAGCIVRCCPRSSRPGTAGPACRARGRSALLRIRHPGWQAVSRAAARCAHRRRSLKQAPRWTPSES